MRKCEKTVRTGENESSRVSERAYARESVLVRRRPKPARSALQRETPCYRPLHYHPGSSTHPAPHPFKGSPVSRRFFVNSLGRLFVESNPLERSDRGENWSGDRYGWSLRTRLECEAISLWSQVIGQGSRDSDTPSKPELD